MVTRDKDFDALVFLSKVRTHGIIFLRMNPRNIEQVHNTLIEYIKHLNPEDIMAKFVTIEPDKYRIRGTLST